MNLRAAAVLLLLLGGPLALAGCATDRPLKDIPVTCPYWQHGLGGPVIRGQFIANITTDIAREDKLGQGRLSDDGKPLDLVSLNFGEYVSPGGGHQAQGIRIHDGRILLHFIREGEADTEENWLESYDIQFPSVKKTEWTFDNGDHLDFTIQVALAHKDLAPNPGVIVAKFTFLRNLDNDSRTPSEALVHYNGEFWYRQCGAGMPAL